MDRRLAAAGAQHCRSPLMPVLSSDIDPPGTKMLGDVHNRFAAKSGLTPRKQSGEPSQKTERSSSCSHHHFGELRHFEQRCHVTTADVAGECAPYPVSFRFTIRVHLRQAVPDDAELRVAVQSKWMQPGQELINEHGGEQRVYAYDRWARLFDSVDVLRPSEFRVRIRIRASERFGSQLLNRVHSPVEEG